jgi:hypothetical protein
LPALSVETIRTGFPRPRTNAPFTRPLAGTRTVAVLRAKTTRSEATPEPRAGLPSFADTRKPRRTRRSVISGRLLSIQSGRSRPGDCWPRPSIWTISTTCLPCGSGLGGR